jgi:CRP-like cAMP-binding protein
VATSLTAVRTRDLSRLVAALESTDSEGSQVARAWRLCRHAAETRLVRHIVRLGRLPAYERVADLLVDLHERQRRAGLADARTMNLPLTQEALADHLGLSIVHVNRTLQQLRRDRMIDYHAGRVVMRDAERLASIAAYRG